MSKIIIFSIKDIANVLQERQKNNYDGRFAVCGDTGDGKSTLINKILYRIPGFNPRKQQVYSQQAIIQLLLTQERGICWDDEAINSGYKKDWQSKGQQEQIKILTNYRDSLNIYASALPNFFTLQKDLRDLFFMMIHVVERGVGVVHLALKGRLYGQDKWDAKNNAKIEESWTRKAKKNPNFRIPYWELSTFAGFIFFGPCTKAQEELYKQIKKEKRAKEYEDQDLDKEQTFHEKLYKALTEGKLTKTGLLDICSFEGKKYSSVTAKLNMMLTDRRTGKSVSSYLKEPQNPSSNNLTSEIKDIIPSFTQVSG